MYDKPRSFIIHDIFIKVLEQHIVGLNNYFTNFEKKKFKLNF